MFLRNTIKVYMFLYLIFLLQLDYVFMNHERPQVEPLRSIDVGQLSCYVLSVQYAMLALTTQYIEGL